MVHSATFLTLALLGSASAHSAIPLVKGDVAGAMTGLGIDPDVPVVDKNKDVIEKDANQMPNRNNALANGLGTLNGKTKITLDMLNKAVQNGGTGSVPQVDKQLQVTYRQMVVDGRFDETKGAKVLIDTTATGNFQNALEGKVAQAPDVVKTPSIERTTVVGKDMPMVVEMPAGFNCSGPQQTCLVRIVNGKNEGNQLWGGHVVVQQVVSGTAGAVPGSAGGSVKASSHVKREMLLKRAEDMRIYVRDGGVSNLVKELKAIHVRDEPELDAREEEEEEMKHPTLEDMIEFEKNN